MSFTEDLLKLREAEVEALRKEILKLNIEIVNRDFKIQQLEDAINK